MNNDINPEATQTTEQPTDDLMNLDAILEPTPNVDLNVVQPDSLVIPDLNIPTDNKCRR